MASNPYSEFESEANTERNFQAWKERQERLIRDAEQSGDAAKGAKAQDNLRRTNLAIGRSKQKQAALQRQMAASSSGGCLVSLLLIPLRLIAHMFSSR
jgi:CRISPR/Cas system CMR-associated protein Cmr1 (group 7 of RAMP superfamily)